MQTLSTLILGAADTVQLAEHTNTTPRNSTIFVPAVLRRAGKEMRLVIDGGQPTTRVDPTLAKLVCQAITFREQMLTANDVGIAELAENAGVSGSHYTRVLRLGFLAPDIPAKIANGRLPVGLTATKLQQDTRLPLLWAEQDAMLRT